MEIKPKIISKLQKRNSIFAHKYFKSKAQAPSELDDDFKNVLDETIADQNYN